jgi:hypothetical protein
MRRLPVVLVALLVGLAVSPTAAARQSQTLCTYDPARGPVPADFVVDACVDDAAVTVRNSLAVPVLIRVGGDLGAPVRVHTSAGTAAALTRDAAEKGDVLMPGDVARWPLGPGEAELIVTDTDLRMPVAVADTLASFLPHRDGGRPDPLDQQAFGALLRQIAPVVTARAACVRDRNFLQRAACDVDASTAIAGAVADRLPLRVAAEVTPELLDAGQWLQWSSAARMAAALPDTGRRRLVLGPRPVASLVASPAEPQPRTSAVSRPAPPPSRAPQPGPAPAPPPAPAPAPPAAPPAPAPAAPPPSADPGDRGEGDDRGGKRNGRGGGNGKGHGHGKKHRD